MLKYVLGGSFFAFRQFCVKINLSYLNAAFDDGKRPIYDTQTALLEV